MRTRRKRILELLSTLLLAAAILFISAHRDRTGETSPIVEWLWLSLLVIPVIRLAIEVRRDWLYRIDHGLCRDCGYDIRASAGQCPECGRPLAEHERVRLRRLSERENPMSSRGER
jgi:hypothetical protein